jgi:hypothetical protein
MKIKMGLNCSLPVLAVTLGLSLSATEARAAGTVTAEKNCNVRIEGEDFKVGDRVVVFSESGGKQKRLAIVEIAKVSAAQKSLGRVVKGPTMCSVLKGALVEIADAKGNVAKVSALPGLRMDSELGVGISFLGYPSLAYPGKEIDKSVSRLRTASVLGKFDFYPLAFLGSSFVERGIGFGLDFAYSSVFPQSEIAGSAGEVVGKLSTTLTDLRADVTFRVLYGQDKLSTEFRLSPYLSRKVTQTYSGEASADSPLANLTVNGMAFGIAQRVSLNAALSAKFLAMYGLSMKGSTVDAFAGTTVPLSSASGYVVDVGLDYFASKMKIFGLFRYEEFSAEGVSVDDATLAESGYELKANKFLFASGIGFAL